MNIKTTIKMLTLLFFVTLISGFTLHKGGYLFNEKKTAYIPDPNGGTGCEMKRVLQQGFGLNTFQKLKLSGGFDPDLFDTLFILPPINGDDHFMSSTKSMPVKFTFEVKDSKTFLETQIKKGRKRK